MLNRILRNTYNKRLIKKSIRKRSNIKSKKSNIEKNLNPNFHFYIIKEIEMRKKDKSLPMFLL